jgi:hypothetical protein
MTRRRLFSLGAALMLVPTLTGCKRPLKDQLEGKWRQTNGRWELTFLKDGTLSSAFGPFELTGKWKTPDEKTVVITPQGFLGAAVGDLVCPAEMKDGRLSLNIHSVHQEFQRVDQR